MQHEGRNQKYAALLQTPFVSNCQPAGSWLVSAYSTERDSLAAKHFERVDKSLC